jgi:hypothetical protein
MTFLRNALASLVSLALAGSAIAALPAAPGHGGAAVLQYTPPAYSAFYSFADVYRLTVAGAAMAQYPQAAGPVQAVPALGPAAQHAQGQMRVASTEQLPGAPVFQIATPEIAPAGNVFSIAAMPQPSRWLLFLSGLALAAWVARRRLGYSL